MIGLFGKGQRVLTMSQAQFKKSPICGSVESSQHPGSYWHCEVYVVPKHMLMMATFYPVGVLSSHSCYVSIQISYLTLYSFGTFCPSDWEYKKISTHSKARNHWVKKCFKYPSHIANYRQTYMVNKISPQYPLCLSQRIVYSLPPLKFKRSHYTEVPFLVFS